MALTDPGFRPGLPATTTEVRSGPATDPLAWLATAPAHEERWFWEVPEDGVSWVCLLYTSPSPRDKRQSRMPSSA